MIRVFIADDHEVVRAGVKRLVDEAKDMRFCGEAASATEVLAGGAVEQCDVLVLDVRMPGGGGPHVVREILRRPRAPRIVVYTMLGEDSHAVAYLRAGAGAFMSKRRPLKELAEAIRTVHEGRRYVSPALAEHLFENQIDLTKAPHELLTDREFEVVQALAEGRRPTEIAAELGLAPSTVNTHVQRIKDKLGVKTIVEIVAYAQDNDLLG